MFPVTVEEKCKVFIHVRLNIRTSLELNEITDVTILLLRLTHQFLAASKERLLFACSFSICQMETSVCTDMHVRACEYICACLFPGLLMKC